MNVGEAKEFAYKGSVETWEVPENGWYLLEGWGAQGGRSGGKGGYAQGCKNLKKGQTLYIAVGGMPSNDKITSGGFNGGGASNAGHWACYGGAGGGATHIAFVDGTLKSIGYAEFVTNQKGILVGGGGGGSSYVYVTDPVWSFANPIAGGYGGGLSGQNGFYSQSAIHTERHPLGGTQTSGYSFGEGQTNNSGGGGGLYGGYGGTIGYVDETNGYNMSGGGGSSFIGNLESWGDYSPSTTAGIRDGNGLARITLLDKKSLELYLGGLSIEGLALGDIEIQNIAIGDLVLS